MPKRGGLPPIEVMKEGPRRSLPSGSRVIQSEPVAESDDWLAALKHPVILRVPRGYAVLAVIGMIGLIVLAYIVGQKQGGAEAAERVKQEMSEMYGIQPGSPDLSRIRPTVGGGGSDIGKTGAGGVSGGLGTPSGGGSPRQIAFPGQDNRLTGYNYVLLARRKADEARRIMQFFATYGFATVAIPDDNGWFVVFSSDYGCKGNPSDDVTAIDHVRKLKEVGRAWKRSNNNSGPDLADMYWQLREAG